MKRKLVKILSIILIISTIMSVCNIAIASTGSDLVDQFSGSNISSNSTGGKMIDEIVKTVLSTIRIVAVGIAIIMLTYLGIKYMSAAPSEKAGIKTQLMVFVIGAIVVFGAVKILEIIRGYANQIG